MKLVWEPFKSLNWRNILESNGFRISRSNIEDMLFNFVQYKNNEIDIQIQAE